MRTQPEKTNIDSNLLAGARSQLNQGDAMRRNVIDGDRALHVPQRLLQPYVSCTALKFAAELQRFKRGGHCGWLAVRVEKRNVRSVADHTNPRVCDYHGLRF